MGFVETLQLNGFTDRCQSAAAFSDCSTTSNETDNEQQSSSSNNGHCWDEGVHVFKEVIVVVVCNEDIGANVTQDTSSCLQAKQTTSHMCFYNALHFNCKLNCTSGDILKSIENNLFGTGASFFVPVAQGE